MAEGLVYAIVPFTLWRSTVNTASFVHEGDRPLRAEELDDPYWRVC